MRRYIYLLLIVTNTAIAEIMNITQQQVILDDLPEKSDLQPSLVEMEKIINFLDQYKACVDINVGLGVFLSKIQLKQVSTARLPSDIKTRVESIVNRIENIMAIFNDMVSRTYQNSSSTVLSNLFTEPWSTNLPAFSTNLLYITPFYTKRELENIYKEWSEYHANLYRFHMYQPRPQIADQCLMEFLNIRTCNVSQFCSEIAFNGSDFGYGLTHRLIFLILVRNSRGCAVKSWADDKKLIDTLCSKAYNELQYQSLNTFQVNVALEQVTSCLMEGHAQFLRRSWLRNVLFTKILLRHNEGLEPMTRRNAGVPKWKFVHIDQDGGFCDPPATGGIAAMSSATIRYILEKYY